MNKASLIVIFIFSMSGCSTPASEKKLSNSNTLKSHATYQHSSNTESGACGVQAKPFSYTTFDKRVDRMSRLYNKNAGADVLASFSVTTNQEYYPFLTRTAKKLGLSKTINVCAWSAFPKEQRNKSISEYLDKIKTNSAKSQNIEQCIRSTSSKNESYSSIPYIEHIVALCALEAGVIKN